MGAHRFAFGSFVLDTGQGMLTRDGLPVGIGNRGVALLSALLEANNQVVSKAALMDAAWPGIAVEESNLSVQIAALRKILGPSPGGGDWITTIPRVGYRFTGAAAIGGDNTAMREANSHSDVFRKPSIAVLPFTNVSGEKEQQYLADGMTEDIITALARFRWFLVIARNSSFAYRNRPLNAKLIAQELGVRYLLEGSVRKSSRRFRICVQLVDAVAGTHIWAERYDVEDTEVFAIQDAIAERVAGAIEPELLKSEGVLAATRHTGNVTAWDLVRQGMWRFHQVTRTTHLEARDLFRQACRLDPQLPEAHFWRARVNAGILAYGWSDDPASDWQEGLEAAIAAIHLDEKNPYCHYGLAIVSVYGGRLEQAIRAAEKAVELSPSFALGHLVLGMAKLFSGRAAEAIPPLNHGLQLSPHDPQNFVWFNLLALAHLFAGDAESGLTAALRAVNVRPDWRPGSETLVCCYVALGQPDMAHRLASDMVGHKLAPGDALAPFRKNNPHWAEQMDTVLGSAGIK